MWKNKKEEKGDYCYLSMRLTRDSWVVRGRHGWMQSTILLSTKEYDYTWMECDSSDWLLNFMAKKKERKLQKLLVFCCARSIHYNHKCYSGLCIPYRGACLILNRYMKFILFPLSLKFNSTNVLSFLYLTSSSRVLP